MAGERIILAELDLDVQALVKASMESKQAILELRNEQKELKKSGEEGSAQFIRNEAELKRLTPIYNAQTKAIAAQVSEGGKLQNQTMAITEATERLNITEQEYRDNNQQLYALRKNLVKGTEDYQKSLDMLNGKIDENNAYLKENGSAADKLRMNIGAYREDIVGAAQDLNPLNGGLSGFIERAQTAGGLGPFLGGALKTMAAGIWGVTKASLAFLATPIGAVIGAIGIAIGGLVTYLRSTQEGMDKITAVTRPLQAVFSALLGVVQNVGKFLFEAFSNPKKTMVELYEFVKQNLINRFKALSEIIEGIVTLDFKKVVDGTLQAATGVEDMTDKIKNAANETGKFLSDAAKKGSEIDRLTKEIEKSQLTLNRKQIEYNDLLDEQQLIAKNTSLDFAERKKASEEIIRISKQMGDEEAAIIQKKIERLKIEQSLNDTSREGVQEMIDLEVELDAAMDRGLEAQKEQLRVIAGARKEAMKEAADARQKTLDDAVSTLKLEYDIFIQMQGDKAKSVEEQIALAEELRKKQIEIAEADYAASKKTSLDKLALQKATNDANIAFMATQTTAMIENADKELQNILANNKTKLDNNKFLNDEMVKQEIERLKIVAEAEKDNAQLKLDAGKLSQEEYYAEIDRINEDNYKKSQALNIQREQAERERKLIDLESQKIIDEENFILQMEADREKLEIKREQELAEAEKTGADMSLIKAKYAQLEKNIDESVNDFKLQQRIDLISGLKGLFGQESKIGKALAVAEIVNSTVSNATKAFQQAAVYASNPLTAALAVNAAIQGGIIIATGVAQTAKTVGAKFEKGGVVEIGGNRHSAGGTKFWGEDGTSFEAERGELIGVMNRNAASHFMAFNNAFPANSGYASSGRYANGGIVSREVASPEINIDTLALKIAEAVSSMPPPVIGVEEFISVANTRASIKQMTSH